MADFVRFLPLSSRGPSDQSGVTSDRREALAGLVEQAAALVADADRARAVFTDAFADDAGLRHDLDATVGEPVTRLRTMAANIRGGGRRSIRVLAAGSRALLVLARDLGVDVELAPLTAGAVALYASGSASHDRRAVISGHTVRASDAGWSFGHGPVLEGTATQIAAFLLGVCDEPPAAVSGRR